MFDFSALYKRRDELSAAIESNDTGRVRAVLFIANNDTGVVETATATTTTTTTTSTSMNLNYVDRHGQTPLLRVCRSGNLEICELLMNNGASQSITNRDGWFPIHLACYYGHTSIIMLLLRMSASAPVTSETSASTSGPAASGHIVVYDRTPITTRTTSRTTRRTRLAKPIARCDDDSSEDEVDDIVNQTTHTSLCNEGSASAAKNERCRRKSITSTVCSSQNVSLSDLNIDALLPIADDLSSFLATDNLVF